MSIEAMKQALEALQFDGFTPEDLTHRSLHAKAIAALRTAIEQALAAPVQEPVAKIVPCYTPSVKRVALNTEYQHLPIGTDLYTTPSLPKLRLHQGGQQMTSLETMKLCLRAIEEGWSFDRIDNEVGPALRKAIEQSERYWSEFSESTKRNIEFVKQFEEKTHEQR